MEARSSGEVVEGVTTGAAADAVSRCVEPAEAPGAAALLAEAALAADWHRPEEDAAWSHLQPEEVR